MNNKCRTFVFRPDRRGNSIHRAMKLSDIKSWFDSHEIEPIPNEGGEGGSYYIFTEDQLLEFAAMIHEKSCPDKAETKTLNEKITFYRFLSGFIAGTLVAQIIYKMLNN